MLNGQCARQLAHSALMIGVGINVNKRPWLIEGAGGASMSAHVLFVGGEDHDLRIPFMTALAQRGYRITTAASAAPEPFDRARLEYIRFRFNRFWDTASDFRTWRTLGRILKDVDADIVHSYDTKLSVLVPYASYFNPRTIVVRTINGRAWTFSSRSIGARALRVLYRPIQRLGAVTTSATVFEHREDQAFFERNWLIGKGESVKIPGAGIDIRGFEDSQRAGPTPGTLRAELGLEGSDVVVTVGRVTREKGILDLLKAAALVHQKRPSVKFLIVGPRQSEGPFAVSDAELAPHSEYVITTGPRSDVPSVLAMADVFAFPSAYAEGLPRALMEAALSGIPIVTTDQPGCMEIVRDGLNGYVTPRCNPRALAEGILTVLDDRATAARMAALGPGIVKNEFSLERVLDQHVELYERLLTRRRMSSELEIDLAHRDRGPFETLPSSRPQLAETRDVN
jgi:glycosyltransferase involved in cell wall biosynthesis